MLMSRLNDVGNSRRQTVPSFGIFRSNSSSYQKAVEIASILEFALIAMAVGGEGILFQYFILERQPAVKACLALGVGVGMLQVFSVRLLGLYRFPVVIAPHLHIARVLAVWAIIALLITLSLRFLNSNLVVSPWTLAAVLLAQGVFLVTIRWAYATAARTLLSAGYLERRRVVLLGEPAQLQSSKLDFLLQRYGLHDVARVAVAGAGGGRSGEITRSLGCALAAASEHRAEEFLLAPRWHSPELLEIIRRRLRVSPLPVRQLRQRSPQIATERALKRGLDVLLSMIALMILWPIFLMAAIAIKLESGSPVIFRQRRGGSNAREFVIFKFRTMKVLEDGPDLVQVRKGDNRLTAVGKFLRRSSIDEIPQLINVLKGDMSLVGPRPHAVAHDNRYKALIADYSFRFQVKPGMTGWAQVHGLRGETASLNEMAERVRLDLWYINNWSVGLDMNILTRTCIEIFRDKAY